MKIHLSTCILSWLPLLALAQDPIWREEFDAGTGLDSSTWSYDLGATGWGNDELQNYVESAVTVDNGSLKITASQDLNGRITSGRIKTEDKFLFKYGTLVAKIKVPDLDAGLWPAFWTMGFNFDTVGWPDAGEIDIMEMGQGLAITQGKVNQRVVSAAHWEHNGEYSSWAGSADADSNLTGSFHTYKMEWDVDYIRTYFDSTMIWEMYIGEDLCTDCTELHHFHFILLNMAVGGRFTYAGEESSPGYMSSQASTLSSTPCTNSSATASSGGCGVRTEITAPLPAVLEVEYIHLYANDHTVIYIAPTDPPSPPTKDDIMPELVPSLTPSPTARPTVVDRQTDLEQNDPPGNTNVIVPNPEEPEPVEPDAAASPDDDTASGGKSGSGKSGLGKSGSGKTSGSGKKSGSSKSSKKAPSTKSGKGGKGRKGGSDALDDSTLQSSSHLSVAAASTVGDSSSTTMVHPSTFVVLVALFSLFNLLWCQARE
jgi:beta-glucanase (GH16 family)